MANANASMRMIDACDADLIVLPELGLTGYTCGDLFASDALLDAAIDALSEIAAHSSLHRKVVIVGLPLVVGTSLMNVAAVIADGRIEAIIPKTFLPTYREFYEGRHFRGATAADPSTSTQFGDRVPFGTDLLFRLATAAICGSRSAKIFGRRSRRAACQAVAGANVLLNLSASNEIDRQGGAGDVIWCVSQSGRCMAAYVYASARPRRVDHRFGLRRPLLDRRKRRLARPIASSRRRASCRGTERRRSRATSTCNALPMIAASSDRSTTR